MINGFVHSLESFGTVDGPGIRFVVFLQGCPMRCAYCHNPDTWTVGKGKSMNATEILAEYSKKREFYKNGGITVTGGEPLLQAEFVAELFRLAKQENIHTCLDTSGIIFDETNEKSREKIDALLDFCDLVMLDIKHIDSGKHKDLTGFENTNVLAFAKYLEKRKIPVWIRTVIVSGLTDDEADLVKLGKFIGTLSNIEALDVLPYHKMGEAKYKELGIPYRLEGILPTEKDALLRARELILSGIKEEKSKSGRKNGA